MFGILTALLATLALTFANGVQNVVKYNESRENFSCGPDETSCAFGCCPIPNANCCWYGTQCCPPGYTCIIGFCVRSETENGEPILQHVKGTELTNVITDCPSGTTTCGEDLCCPFENAVCCSDKLHCCPNEYKCDIAGGQCIKESSSKFSYRKKLEILPQFDTIKKYPYKVCPGGAYHCPNYASCCIDDTGNWSCCPKKAFVPSKLGNCCMTYAGNQCCPYLCTFFGCL